MVIPKASLSYFKIMGNDGLNKIMIIDNGKIKKIGTKDEVLPYLTGVQECHKCAEELEGRA